MKWVNKHTEIFKKQQIFICRALRDLVPFAQFKKREKHPWRSNTYINFQAREAGALRITMLTAAFLFLVMGARSFHFVIQNIECFIIVSFSKHMK